MYDPTPLLQYLNILREVREYKAFTSAEDPEFRIIAENLAAAMNDIFVVTATDYGLSRYEKMLKIRPESGDSFERRRARILLRLTSQLPFTMRWLENWLESFFGTNNYRVIVSDYVLQVMLTNDLLSLAQEVMKYLREKIPANIGLTVEELSKTWGDVYTGYRDWGDVLGCLTWGEINAGYPTWGDVAVAFADWGAMFNRRTWGGVYKYDFV
ncbi:MAG: YmfQ family protein [Defluviitaleaceae bacterium]|nr:YmfQ family protein [Defluviitaleaceae bacterium]